MGGVTVAERVDVGSLVDSARLDGSHECALETGAGEVAHGGIAQDAGMRARDRREEPERVLVRAPVRSEERQRGVGERNVAILAALAVDLDELTVAVDIGHLEPRAFHKAETTSVDGGEAGAVHRDPDPIEDAPDLLAVQNNRKLFLTLRPGDLEDGPLAAEGVLVEELEAAEGDGVGAAGDFLDGRESDEVVTELLFREGVGRGMIGAGT